MPRPTGILLAACGLALPVAPVAAAPTAAVSAYSYETQDSRSGPGPLRAGITRHGPGAPGSSAATAGARIGAMDGQATMTGCGFEYNGFQQPCNDAGTTSTFADRITIVADAPVNTPVQLQGSYDVIGSLDGTGYYYYTSYCIVAGVGAQGGTGSSGGLVLAVDQLSLDHSAPFSTTVYVGSTYDVSGYLRTSVGNRTCAGGSSTCEASLTTWTMTMTLAGALRFSAPTPPPGATYVQLVAESGHDYTAAPLAVGGLEAPGAALSPAWPNPGRGPVRMDLSLPSEQAVDVAVFDLAGRRVATLARGTFGAGRHALSWDGRDGRGGEARGGMFFVRAKGPGLDATRRVLRLD